MVYAKVVFLFYMLCGINIFSWQTWLGSHAVVCLFRAMLSQRHSSQEKPWQGSNKAKQQLNKAAKRQAKYFFSVFWLSFVKLLFSICFSRPFLIFDISAPVWRGKSTNSNVWLKAPTEANARWQTGRNPPRGECGTSQGHLCSLSQRASCHF